MQSTDGPTGDLESRTRVPAQTECGAGHGQVGVTDVLDPSVGDHVDSVPENVREEAGRVQLVEDRPLLPATAPAA